MASTVITGNQIVRRTVRMSVPRANAFARMIEANPRVKVHNIEVHTEGRRGWVEFLPGNPETTLRLFNEQQLSRAERVEEVKKYQWKRIRHRAWSCKGPDGQMYVIFLDKPKCTCPDWNRIHSIGGKCKHFLCAEIAEERYQQQIERSACHA